MQRFRSEIHHHGFGGRKGNPVRNRLAHGDTGNGAHDGSDAFDVLNVERRHDVDFCGHEFLNVLVPLPVLGSRNIRMGQFVDQNHLRLSREDGVDVHLLENRSLVFDLFPRNRFDICKEFFDALAAVRFHDPDHHVLATALAADCLAEHAEGFAYSRSIAEEKLENASRLLRGRGNFQPLFRLLWQRVIFSAANRKPALE